MTTRGAAVRTPWVEVAMLARGRFTIETGDTETRVAVESGVAQLTSSTEVRKVAAGERASVGEDGRIAVLTVAALASSQPSPIGVTTAPSSTSSENPTATPTTPAERWSIATRLFDAGDRGGAERELRQLLREVGAESEPLHVRASFMLAEIELARGNVVEARPRLDTIMLGPDEQLAEDAATLLAQSYPTPGERALVWKRYLATAPPSAREGRARSELCATAPADACKRGSTNEMVDAGR
jgi:hypothetical protein